MAASGICLGDIWHGDTVTQSSRRLTCLPCQQILSRSNLRQK